MNDAMLKCLGLRAFACKPNFGQLLNNQDFHRLIFLALRLLENAFVFRAHALRSSGSMLVSHQMPFQGGRWRENAEKADSPNYS